VELTSGVLEHAAIVRLPLSKVLFGVSGPCVRSPYSVAQERATVIRIISWRMLVLDFICKANNIVDKKAVNIGIVLEVYARLHHMAIVRGISRTARR
jgi:hypothetical protein